MIPRSVRMAGWMVALVPAGAWAQSNYLGILKPPRAVLETPAGLYSFSAPLGISPRLDSDGYRLKLGYKYSRYFSVEGEMVDSGTSRAPWESFASPGSLSSGFRSTGFGVDTVATLPLWRFSFYGKLGAVRGDTRNGFAPYSASLVADPNLRGTRLRAGLGLRYDFTSTLGIRAELERQAPMSSPFAPEGEADTVSVGLMWRF